MLIPYNQLSNQQKGIIRRISREEGDLFVEGPPGSGKTLISLYTLRDIVENQSIRPLLLMYNHSLYGYLRSAMSELGISDNITIDTKDKFFWSLARNYNITVDSRLPYDKKYKIILNSLLQVDLPKQYDVTVVDEVQDLSSEEWKLIKKLSKRTTSLGDFDQGVYETELKKAEVTGGGLFERLTEIFRFHKNIAKLARLFSRHNADLESQVSRTSQTQPQLHKTSTGNENAKVAEILIGLKYSQQRIGILSPDRDSLESLDGHLKSQGIEFKYYKDNKDLRNHDFTSTTPLLISSFSAKGLEFEHVILFGFNNSSNTVSRLQTKGKLKDVIYVSITRTNSNLYIVVTPETVKDLQDLKIEEANSEANVSFDDIFGA